MPPMLVVSSLKDEADCLNTRIQVVEFFDIANRFRQPRGQPTAEECSIPLCRRPIRIASPLQHPIVAAGDKQEAYTNERNKGARHSSSPHELHD
jgi:hypothetical protein